MPAVGSGASPYTPLVHHWTPLPTDMHSLGQGCLSTEDNRTSSTSSGRKGSKKVRSGCITCKIRKVKCDEAKPYCLRCTKTGRKCDGYLDDAALAIRRRRRRRACSSSLTDTLTAATQQKTTAGSASAILADAPKLSPAATPWLTAALGSRLPTLQPWESAEEKRSFDFFQHITAPRLAGDLDAVFWRVLVLQICHTEPAVRHAVLAISSLHETFLQTSLVSSKKNLTIETPATRSLASPRGHTTPQHEFALKQYNKAIAHLLDDMKTTSNEASSTGTRIKAASRPACRRPVAPLMTCLLFVCIEMLQGKDKEALIHLGQGRHLLKQLYPNQSTVVSGSSDNQTPQDTDPEMVVIRQHLVPLYTRLSLTSFLLGGNPEPIPAALKTLVAHRIPDTFDSIHALRATVHDFLEAVLRFTRRARPIKYPPTRRRRKSSSSFASYRSSSTLSSSPPTSPLSPSSPSSPISRQSPPASPSFDSDTPQADVPRPEPPRALLYELELEKVALSARLSRLRIALSLFRINQPTMMTAPMSPNAAATILLQIHLYLAEVWLATALARAESAFDAYAETFSTIVSLAVTVLDLEHQQQQKQQTQHVGSPAAIPSSVFTLETNVIPALYYVASKCRHRLVRKSALDVLIHNSHRRENLWRADVLGAIATRIIEMEEDHMWKGGRSKTADFESAVKEEGFQHVDPPRDGSSVRSTETEQCGFVQQKPTRIGLANTESETVTSSVSSAAGRERGGLWGGETSSKIDVLFLGKVNSGHLGSLYPRAKTVSASATVFSSSRSRSPRATSMSDLLPNHDSIGLCFNIPERARVHTAVIGPEETNGRWVTLFRKLDGLDGAWDVRADFVGS